MITRFERIFESDNSHIMDVEYQLTDNCNLHCDYCDFANYTPNPSHKNVQSVLSFIDYIRTIKEHIYFKYFGGEPTLHPDFIFLANKLSNINNLDSMLSTNFSFPISFLQDNIDTFKNIEICASAHSRYMSHFSEFLKKVEICVNNDIDLTVNVMMDPRFFDDMLSFYYKCKEICDTRLKIITWDIPYTDIQKDILVDNMVEPRQDLFLVETDFIKQEYLTEQEYKLLDSKFCFNCMFCEAGRRQLYIHNDGCVYFCQKHYGDKRIKSLFNVYTDEPHIYDIYNKDTVCLFDSCRWGLNMPKYRRKSDV